MAFHASGEGTAAAATSLDFTVDVPADNPAVYVSATVNDSRTFTVATCNGVAMTPVREHSGYAGIKTWIITGVPSGSRTVHLETNAAGNITAKAASFDGRHQASPIRDHDATETVSLADSGPTIDAGADDDVVGSIHLIRDSNITALTPGTGQTARGAAQSASYSWTQLSTEAGAAPTVAHTYAYTVSSSSPFLQMVAAVSLQPAAASSVLALILLQLRAFRRRSL